MSKIDENRCFFKIFWGGRPKPPIYIYRRVTQLVLLPPFSPLCALLSSTPHQQVVYYTCSAVAFPFFRFSPIFCDFSCHFWRKKQVLTPIFGPVFCPFLQIFQNFEKYRKSQKHQNLVRPIMGRPRNTRQWFLHKMANDFATNRFFLDFPQICRDFVTYIFQKIKEFERYPGHMARAWVAKLHICRKMSVSKSQQILEISRNSFL